MGAMLGGWLGSIVQVVYIDDFSALGIGVGLAFVAILFVRGEETVTVGRTWIEHALGGVLSLFVILSLWFGYSAAHGHVLSPSQLFMGLVVFVAWIIGRGYVRMPS
jgi:hypothetical protein